MKGKGMKMVFNEASNRSYVQSEAWMKSARNEKFTYHVNLLQISFALKYFETVISGKSRVRCYFARYHRNLSVTYFKYLHTVSIGFSGVMIVESYFCSRPDWGASGNQDVLSFMWIDAPKTVWCALSSHNHEPPVMSRVTD